MKSNGEQRRVQRPMQADVFRKFLELLQDFGLPMRNCVLSMAGRARRSAGHL